MAVLTPIFPLQIVVYPGDSLNLHIFEPRYKELINECYDQNEIFGIPTHFEGNKLSYGTSIQIDKIEKRYPDGKLDIRTTGLEVFIILKLFKKISGKLYSKAEVEYLKQEYNGVLDLNFEILNYINELYKIMSIDKDIADPNDPQFCFKISHYIGMNLEQKFTILSIPDESSRQKYIIDYLKELIPSAKRIENIRAKAKMNGHFRHYNPLDF
jgi:Lon protease-like protein